MNLRRSFAIYCGLGLALCCGCLLLQGQERSQFRIAGTVINADSGRPLPQTRVWIYNLKNPEALQALMTSENGRFEFNQLGPAKYSLQGMRHGFITTAYDAHEEYATAIVTGAGIDTENLTLKLTPTAVLAGNVLDESGEPVRGATVTLYREDHSAGVSRVEQINASGADDLGGYEFSGLEPGNYFVSATAKPWYAVHPASSGNPGTPDLPATVDPSLDVAYPTTYFPDATDADQAPPVPRCIFAFASRIKAAMDLLRSRRWAREHSIPSNTFLITTCKPSLPESMS
jgi:5-hydroxyisourate hydrolase-like protein (transthyretin family)